MTTGTVQHVANLASNVAVPGSPQETAGVTMLNKSMQVQQAQMDILLHSMLPPSAATPNLGAHINTYA